MKKIILFFSLLWVVNCEAQGTWHNLDGGIDGRHAVEAICPDTINNILFVGGDFDSVASIQQTALAKWDDTRWDTTVSSFFYDSKINALIMFHNKLYIGFESGLVAVYDSNKLTYLVNGFNGAVKCFCIYNNSLYAGGSFYGKVSSIARLAGKNWVAVDKGMRWENCCSSVDAMTVYNGQLIAGGVFDTSGSVYAPGIAAYDGTNWKAMGYGIGYGKLVTGSPGDVEALEVYKNKLYAGGEFDYADSILCVGLASWNGIVWDSLPEQPGAIIWALKSFDNYLFMGGSRGYEQKNILKYDGTTLSSVDSGVGPNVYSLGVWNGSLYVGGDFINADTIIAKSIAQWAPDSTSGIKQIKINNFQLSISPNPFSQQATLQFSQPITNNSQLTLYDLTGRKVENYFISTGTKNLIIKRNNLPAGMYFAVVKDEDGSMLGRTKIVVQ